MKQTAIDAIDNILYHRNEFASDKIDRKRTNEKLKEFGQSTGIDVSPLYHSVKIRILNLKE